MQAVVFEEVGAPLREVELPIPKPGPGQLLLRVHACGVCRTDLHLLDGEVEIADPPRVLGHQIVGTVEAAGQGTGVQAGADSDSGSGSEADPESDSESESGLGFGSGAAATTSSSGTNVADTRPGTAKVKPGDRVGVPWLGWTCGECEYCRSGRENLCPRARFTGRDIDGGMAQYTVADARYCFPIPAGYPDAQAAPLMCAGLIGYRALRMCGQAQRIGMYGFGAAAHILTQVCIAQGREVYAFTRAGDEIAQAFARELGAVWAGASQEESPVPLHAAIIFAPVGPLVVQALRAVAPGGTVVCGGIHMSDIPGFPYSSLWEERTLRSVANLTRADAGEFLALAPEVPVRTSVSAYELHAAGRALEDLRAGRFTGAAVVVP
jgi:alcohol dehydrogenase, propanol-preferring